MIDLICVLTVFWCLLRETGTTTFPGWYNFRPVITNLPPICNKIDPVLPPICNKNHINLPPI